MSETVLYQLTETSPFMMSFVFKTAKGNAVIIDGGRPEDLPLLRKIVGKSPIRAWILTHPHVDHISGFTEVLKRSDFSLWPEKIYYHFPDLELIQREEPEQAYTLEEFLAVESRITNRKVTVREKDSFCIDELKVTILQSYEPEQPIINGSLTGNENSLVFRVDSPGKSVLFLGDTGPLGGDRLYQRHWEELKADLVQMAHHGHSGVGAEVYTGNLVAFICLSKILRVFYLQNGLSEQLWQTSMQDLKWKMVECKKVYNIWGTFVPEWFEGFFRMERFGFFKLQFEIKSLNCHYKEAGIILTPESQVINVHIPRTGTKLEQECVQGAYRTAADSFKKRYGLKNIAFVCESWLLYPPNKEVLSPDSNLYAFISAFEILEWGEYKDYSEVWRLFDMNYDGDITKLPQDTSLRRAYAEWIRQGKKTGWGYGIIPYYKRYL